MKGADVNTGRVVETTSFTEVNVKVWIKLKRTASNELNRCCLMLIAWRQGENVQLNKTRPELCGKASKSNANPLSESESSPLWRCYRYPDVPQKLSWNKFDYGNGKLMFGWHSRKPEIGLSRIFYAPATVAARVGCVTPSRVELSESRRQIRVFRGIDTFAPLPSPT